MATITTAARRIARDVNGTSPEFRVYYDADGRRLHSMPHGAWYADHRDPAPDAILCFRGRRGGEGMSQGEAQAWVDAAARYGRYPDRIDAGLLYVDERLRGL
ncbi:hypothetical protein [Bifidobacterium platyrrhinorum]|uniref:Uncharacterized protein n=1 Tax=Bifidobacterium platyrrhinorum TaxID=2661628 RepID=A0A6L9SU15_9BIFI|nr:hypothetical protein [Bifidobacterium platyrrhinorum]NEG56107.1 hypothetical protein [Bifidobacterium platyrrhinorum]